MNALRWIFILPLCFLISIIFSYVNTFFVGFFIDPDSKIWKTIFEIFFNWTQGYFFVSAAFVIAPKFKIQTTLIFLILWTLFVIISTKLLILNNLEHLPLFDCIILIMGGLSAYLSIKFEKKY